MSSLDRSSIEATLGDVIAAQARATPAAVAICAPGRRPLTYRGLQTQIEYVAAALRAAGIGANDPVAIVLPQTPEMAVVSVAVAICATAAPLNPMYTASELDFALADLKVRAVLVARGTELPVAGVARGRGIPIVEVSALRDGEAGTFTLAGPEADARDAAVRAGDVALLLHTSGTTGRPKVVPLTHANLLYSARNCVAACGFTAADRSLGLLPLFHISLLSDALVPFCTGASIISLPGFAPAKLAEIIAEFRPTWYDGVPTMQHAVRAQIARDPSAFAGHSLRFVGIGGAAMAPAAMEDLEQALGIPALGVYGMTEGTGFSTANPLPPGRRKLGSCGVAVGQEVAILAEDGELAPNGAVGEVVLRGPNVMSGYRDDAAANQAAFHRGWFRTGDLGRLDEDGHLWLVGRSKEMINRGGEKIAPVEIDEVMTRHPAVAQAVAFSLPHERLGEDVGAAVVMRPGHAADEEDLRAHAARHLAAFKVPRRIVVVAELPKGPTGKVARVGMAERLGVTAGTSTAPAPPRTPTEASLARLFAEVLGVERVGIDEDFFALGGDSLLAVTLLDRIEEELGLAVSVAALFERGTVIALADDIAAGHSVPAQRLLVPVRAGGSGTPFVCVHGLWGDVLYLRRLLPSLGAAIPLYGLRVRSEGDAPLPRRIEEMAAAYVEELLAFQPHGPYLLGGYSIGGVVAFAMACRLASTGRRVAELVLIDSLNPAVARIELSARYGRYLLAGARRVGERWRQPGWIGEQMRRSLSGRPPGAGQAAPDRFREIEAVLGAAARNYRPPLYEGRVTLFRTRENVERSGDPLLGWGPFARGGVEAIDLRGRHLQLLEPPWVEELGARLSLILERAR